MFQCVFECFLKDHYKKVTCKAHMRTHVLRLYGPNTLYDPKEDSEQ
jgi:hypothetical protein